MDIVKELEKKLRDIFESLKQELLGIRANRPNPKLVEDLRAEVYGRQMTVKQLGSISVIPPREINISVWDKEAVAAVVKAVETSSQGLTANVDGNVIRINLPILTDERRQELIKLIKSLTEQSRIKIRASRDEFNKKAEQDFKDKKIGEDQKFKLKKLIQDSVDRVNKDLENLLAAKIKEINE